MAINPIDFASDKTVTLSHSSLNHYKNGNSPARRLVKMDSRPVGSISNLPHKHGKYKNYTEYKSPYLRNSNHRILGDSLQLLSRVTEKRFVHKNGRNIMTILPLDGNIYKVNSSEFQAKQSNKKVLKSVLTLPNDTALAPQLCTVSDMNDSEYFSGKENMRKKCRKRKPQIHLRKYFPRSKGMESESQCCSDTDLRINTSSLDIIKKCGDGKRTHKPKVELKGNVKEKVKPHDVWAVLRNMNRFQFQTSPRFSDESFPVSKQKSNLNRRNNRNDLRVFETRRTEEIAYLTSYDVPKSIKSLSHCSSFDKVTVIDRAQNLKLGKEIEDKPKKKKTGKFLGPKSIQSSLKNKALPSKQRNNWKAMTNTKLTNQKKNENLAINSLSSTDATSKMIMFVHPGYYGESDEILNNNASVDLGYESKTTENDEDFLTCNRTTTNTTQVSQCSQSKLSDNSGSSKAAAFTKNLVHNKVKTKLKVEPVKQINGITKVILSTVKNMEKLQQRDSVAIEPPKRNVCQAMVTLNNNVDPPKLTKTEINRQLHMYKFPVVILGKDQLRSTIHLVNSNHPQFDGLDKQIWPYMRSWYGIERPVKVMRKQINSNIHNKKTKIDEIEKKVPLKSNMIKPVKVLDKITKQENKRTPLPLSELINQTTQQRKLKPIRQFKDRMIKLLYKNSSALSVVDPPGPGKNVNNVMTQSIEISTETRNKCDASTNHTKENMKKLKIEKRSWAKAKWASDFIETVIKKVKSGAYYNQDVINKVCNDIFSTDKKEIDVQTDFITDVTPIASFNDNYNRTSDEDADKFIGKIPIPGFDNVLPVLEIKTISLNEIAVKHCGTNIMVHFDVTVPTNSITDVKRDSSVIPIDITTSLTKVFKCKTSIINAVLPAELCSIVPSMLRNIVETGQHLALFTAPINMPDLTTISEVANRSESIASVPALTSPTTILPLLLISPKLRQQLNGGYFEERINKTQNFHLLRKTSCLVKYDTRLFVELGPKIERNFLFDIESHLSIPLKVIYHKEPKILPAIKTESIEIKTCTALQPYLQPITNNEPISMLRLFSLMNLFETMATYINNTCFRMIKTDINLPYNFNMGKTLSIPNVITLSFSALKADALNDCSKSLTSGKITILPDTDEKSKSQEKVKLPALCDDASRNTYPKYNKAKRKSYIKLHRKCNSASYINGEKIMQLDRIVNLNDFFQVFGPGKLLSSVFDGQSGSKIMSSIKELKKWTTEINPTQALLVVLLANKIETPNVLRYRPMLLQGIAVKRITKAIELDMEIEVIKRENLNGIPQFEGITYLPASVENQDSLYEEFCWIAKNTASDYQKPFDHSSEKLLKSLLEKRKQLNPSYLRVMARYVGLGLLKSPGKRQ